MGLCTALSYPRAEAQQAQVAQETYSGQLLHLNVPSDARIIVLYACAAVRQVHVLERSLEASVCFISALVYVVVIFSS